MNGSRRELAAIGNSSFCVMMRTIQCLFDVIRIYSREIVDILEAAAGVRC